MKISFLVTFYNQKEFVAQALDSILAIDKPCEWEIVVGDDGSTDGTIEEIRHYVHKYPDHIFLHVMPRDPSRKYDSVERASMNRLSILERSTGDFFCTLDGDDHYCDRDFVRDALEIMRDSAHISVVMFGYRYFGNVVSKDEVILPREFHYRLIEKTQYLRSYYIHAGACVYRRCSDSARIEFIKKMGYFDDNDIVINNLHHGEVFVICRAIYAYRQTGNSIFTSMSQVEQSVLNVLGCDVDIELVDRNYRKDIIYRYRYSIITMYLFRNKLREILGTAKYDRYLNRSRAMENTLAHQLLTWKSLGQKEKGRVSRFMLPLILDEAKYVVKSCFARMRNHV